MRKNNSKQKKPIEDRLLSVGLDHYLRFGARNMSIRKIAAQCRVNLGSFVYYFGTKEKFISTLFDKYYTKMMKRLELGLVEMPRERDPLKTLRHLMGIMTEFVQENPEFIGRLLLDHLSGDKMVSKIIMKHRPKHIPLLLGLIDECQRKKLIRKDMSVIQTGMCGMFVGGLVPVLGLAAAAHMPIPFRNLLKAEILDPSFREKRIDMIIRGIAI